MASGSCRFRVLDEAGEGGFFWGVRVTWVSLIFQKSAASWQSIRCVV
jgi:hypothetical protein